MKTAETAGLDNQRGGGTFPLSLIQWHRPPSYWDVVVPHLPLALGTGTALLLPHILSLHRLPLIPCTFLQWTGYPCPFCGFTRSFWAVAGGDWTFALLNCPLALAVFFAILLLFLWNTAALLLGVTLSPVLVHQKKPGRRLAAIVFIALLFLLNWIYRLTLGLQ